MFSYWASLESMSTGLPILSCWPNFFGITEEQLNANRKHVWFFAYTNLRMERRTVFVLTSLSAQCQYL